MLKELYVRNFALIDNLQLEFASGFNVLTGETGAGKSILLDSIGILCGNRASSELIRRGEEKALVEGMFLLTEELKEKINSLEVLEVEDDELSLSREISASGSNKCRINYRTVPLAAYQKVGSLLFDIHGQNQEQSILKPDKQLELLDKYISLDKDAAELLKQVGCSFGRWKKHRLELDALLAAEGEREDLLGYYQFAIREIDDAALVEDEEERLKEERNKILNSEKLAKKGDLIYGLLGGDGVLASMDTVLHSLREMSALDPSLEGLHARMEDSYYTLEELNREFKAYYGTLEYDEERINRIEARLELIFRLERKYGRTIGLILDKRGEMQQALDRSENKDALLSQLEEALEAELMVYQDLAGRLARRREAGARLIETGIREKLAALNIYPDGFRIEFSELEEPSPTGGVNVEFLFSPNVGEGVRPLRKIASGGEVSRVMLAFKGIFAEIDSIPTLIFDEIDSGVGGEALLKVAEALEQIGRKRQVICVTHSAILAAFADQVHSVRKETREGRTSVRIESLGDEEALLEELSRMLGGRENFNVAKDQGKEMILFAKKKKRV